MNAEGIVKLIEEMVDMKIRLQMESTIKTNPEVAKVLAQKRESDTRRLELIKNEMARILSGADRFDRAA
jgi:hypothetical protein